MIKLRRMGWAKHVVRRGAWRGIYRDIVCKPEGKGPLGRPMHRWEHNTKMDVQEVGWGHGMYLSGSG